MSATVPPSHAEADLATQAKKRRRAAIMALIVLARSGPIVDDAIGLSALFAR